MFSKYSGCLDIKEYLNEGLLPDLFLGFTTIDAFSRLLWDSCSPGSYLVATIPHQVGAICRLLQAYSFHLPSRS